MLLIETFAFIGDRGILMVRKELLIVNKKEYLSEEKYQKIKKILITLGFISLAVPRIR